MFDDIFEFSDNYRENIGISALIVWAMCLIIFGISLIPDSKPAEQFVTSVVETNQPNCVIGAYVMFAKERLDQELLIGKLQTTYPILTNKTVGNGAVKALWNDMFPDHKLICTFDCRNENTFTNKPAFGKPYLWIGKWDSATNDTYHACLMYFNTNGVTFKHFIYNPKTRYNYYVRTNYQFFFDRTMYLYQVK